jgi:hypothetical protein
MKKHTRMITQQYISVVTTMNRDFAPDFSSLDPSISASVQSVVRRVDLPPS